MKRYFIFVTIALALAGRSDPKSTIDELRRTFVSPPDDARITMRWWWFGSAITRGELERELKAMKAAGIGGVEIQPVYPLELDDPQRSIRNLPYLSDDFSEKVRLTSELARQLGMRVDVTLGSGWPYGGPHTPITEGAGRLRCDRINIPENETTMPVPAMENGEKLIAVFLANGE
ncbi:MAG: glycoside hydrolase, partial [Acidobacteriaceae bacterium]|nr:glycoside hydrolase [Acidobacteriaceae bacterium]